MAEAHDLTKVLRTSRKAVPVFTEKTGSRQAFLLTPPKSELRRALR